MENYGQSEFGFEDLDVYQAARSLRHQVYELARQLPPEEKYSLGQQLRRAAVSLTSNIAEGYGRHHWQENSQFRHSRGSLMEIVDQFGVCLDENYAQADHVIALREEALTVLRLLNGYIAYLQRQKTKQE